MSEALRDRLAAVLVDYDAARRTALAQSAGVSERTVSYARAGRPISAEDYLRLCANLLLDPAPEIPGGLVLARVGAFDHATLGMGLRIVRGLKGHSIRRGAATSGLSVTTLSRLENGNVVSIANVLKACRYVGVHPFGYVKPQFHVKQHLNSLNKNDFARSAA